MQKPEIDYGLPVDVLASTLPPMLTIRQAAGTGAASDRMLRKMCAEGEIKATKVGNEWRIMRDPFLRQFMLID
ncbi:MAG: excisionase family DNA-binding protein [Atopobiaceae bacterium]|jgi:excisionase family DNA binding protein|nr:excisionase family DNA-binding protein [Atopobiaceae bacterium]